MNMEASRWWLHLAKAGDLKVVVACAEREGDRIGSTRAAAAGEAGEPSDGGRSCIGASAVGAVGRGGIHRCGSLRADDCGLIDRRRAVFSWDVLRLNSERRRGHERLIRG